MIGHNVVHLQQGCARSNIHHAGSFLLWRNTHTHTHSGFQYVTITFRLKRKNEKMTVKYLCVGFSLFALSVAGEVVQCAILHEGSEGEDEADRDEQVHGSDIGNLGQGLPGDGA